jgi:hypothetical protein
VFEGVANASRPDKTGETDETLVFGEPARRFARIPGLRITGAVEILVFLIY